MNLTIRAFAALSLALLTACAHETGSNFGDLQSDAFRNLGRTAIVIRKSDFYSDKFNTDHVRQVVLHVLEKVLGTTEASIVLSDKAEKLSDYEIVLAARKANADTVCIVSVNSLTWNLGLDIPFIILSSSDADYNVRFLTVDSGKLLLESDRDDYTDSIYLSPHHPYTDLERGLTSLLKYYDFFGSNHPASRPSTVAFSIRD